MNKRSFTTNCSNKYPEFNPFQPEYSFLMLVTTPALVCLGGDVLCFSGTITALAFIVMPNVADNWILDNLPIRQYKGTWGLDTEPGLNSQQHVSFRPDGSKPPLIKVNPGP